jgi:hypothetical protein
LSSIDEIEILNLPREVARNLYNTFLVLWGRKKEDQVPGANFKQRAVLLEENFIKNIKHLIGTDCPFFGKLLFLQMGGGYDKARIDMISWINYFAQFYKDEDRLLHLKLSFKLIDIDRDGTLNILNLLHLYKNIPSSSDFGLELLKLIKFHIKHNIEVNSFSKRVTINFEVFLNILSNRFSLRNEIRKKILGIGVDTSMFTED